nr:ribonuclease Z [Klebsiella pneumoniae]
MSSNAPTPIPKAKRRGIPLQSGKLPALVSVPGFYASQRFRALSEGCPCYLALHDIHDATVIDSDAYRRNGGGHFARWQSAIADWHRHLYLTNNTLREVAPDEVLLLGDTAEDLPVAAPILLQPGGRRPNKPGMPPSSHETTCITWPRLPPSLSISPSPPGYATRRSAREVAMSPAPFYTLTAGDLTVTAVSDGLMSAPLSLLSGISREEAEHLQRHSGLASPETIAIGAYLIRGRGNTMLVDTGTGGANGVGGELIANLARLGVGPEEIDAILLTHAHPDHIGSLLSAAGTPAYPNATVFLPTRESAYWLATSTFDNASDRGRRNVLLVRRVLANCAAQIRGVDDEEVIAGSAVPSARPYAGHTGYRLEAGDTSLLIWGDIVHFPSIQSARPEASVAFDVDPEQARRTVEILLRRAASERWLIAGMHLGLPGFARVENTASGYCLRSV